MALQVLAKKPPIELHIEYYSRIFNLKWGKDISTNEYTILASDLENPTPYCMSQHPSIQPINIDENISYQDIIIYTDGSKIVNKVGCAFVVFSDNIELYHQTFKLGELSTIFQVEMIAILEALVWTNREYRFKNIIIISDSASALATIKSTKLNQISTKIKEQITASTNNYNFMWTRAHEGTFGNERADELAKSATNDPKLLIIYNKISLQTAKKLLWNDVLNKWQQKWNTYKEKTMYKFFLIIKDMYKYDWIQPTHLLIYYINTILYGSWEICKLPKKISTLNTNR
ncbi:uncharacterized protein LOC111632969 [Centruroides sculpturatus]|uniref:uncharacterized protein LOC111632969 n=1 Tax=Centruroides sculpturatus TaxID=218467 RepID=UPI000C6CA3EE|nr:uncharacterized protein LOC111632969 [Centruroides sculpturatus]